jgi:O-antigen biosynthesis protein WbqP
LEGNGSGNAAGRHIVNGKRIFDLTMAILLSGIFCVPMILIVLLVKMSSSGPVLYWSDRVGINNQIFKMPKFRTMRTDTPAVATHLLGNSDDYMIPVGSFLRKFSLDELPQLWSIIKGDMSFVGPRPALYNQDDLINMRTINGLHEIMPGITGWAQINGRDDIPIPQKVEYDAYYMDKKSFFFDLKILYRTVLKVIRAEGVRH